MFRRPLEPYDDRYSQTGWGVAEPVMQVATPAEAYQLRRPDSYGFTLPEIPSLTEPQLGDSLQRSSPGFMGEFSSKLTPPTMPESSPADWSNVAGAGIQAGAQTAATIANIAAQRAAMDQAANQSAAGRMLSERLAKLQLAQGQDQFAKQQGLQGLMWALNAGRQATGTMAGARDLRAQDEKLMSDLMARIFL